MCHLCQHHEQTGARVTKIETGPVSSAYRIYGYRAFYVTFDDGLTASTSRWMYPDAPKTRRHLETIPKVETPA